jgi:hypothetical protein
MENQSGHVGNEVRPSPAGPPFPTEGRKSRREEIRLDRPVPPVLVFDHGIREAARVAVDSMLGIRPRHDMTTTQRRFAGVATVGLVLLLSWLTILPGTPHIYAPLNLLVVIPAFMSSGLFGDSYLLAIAVVPVFFGLWCWPVLRGRTTLAIRSVVLLILAVVLSASSLIFGARYGVEYQSVGYVIGVAAINIGCWVLLGVLALLARRRPSFVHNLGFHAALFAWLAWCAFPYLGELP